MSIENNKYYKLKYTTYEIELEIIKFIEDIDYYEDFRLYISEEERKIAHMRSVVANKYLDEAMRYYAYVRD